MLPQPQSAEASPFASFPLVDARIERSYCVDDHVRGVAEEAWVDPIDRVARLVMVAVILDTEIHERDAGLMERPVV